MMKAKMLKKIFLPLMLLLIGNYSHADEITYSKAQYVNVIGQVALMDLCSDDATLNKNNISRIACIEESENNLSRCEGEFMQTLGDYNGEVALYRERDRLNAARFGQCLLQKIIAREGTTP